eukprot:CAMPEP_0172925896 /NCGR_PEP_ID=MMETSP1075-20121228/214586_1 /TAXON_ID=2916 /ORGANISM="Ceratium fusus, Strain PA161109" /LENGTH=32 /DNA_ID= /DNA_START= /DNA_END= /DNA_ORIENTATION=
MAKFSLSDTRPPAITLLMAETELGAPRRYKAM